MTKIDGVTEVHVDLLPGELSQVHVTSSAALDDRDLDAAIKEAGYTLVPA